jgi:hypothetical protein
MAFILRNKIIDPNQHGFAKGISCTTNLLEAMDIIISALDDGFGIEILFAD